MPTIPVVVSYAAAYFSLIMAVAVLFRDRHSFAHRVFAAGMFLFAAEELFWGFSYSAILPDDVLYWQKRVLVASTIIPGVWLVFSITYARTNAFIFRSKWKWALAAVCVAPALFVVVFR